MLVALVSRLAIAAVALLALGASFPRRNPLLETRGWHASPFEPHSLPAHLVRLGDRWDARWYLAIADGGYGDVLRTTAFFPLYPLGVGFGALAGAPSWATASVLSLACLLAAAAALMALTRAHGGTPSRGVFAAACLAGAPSAVVLGAAYPESLLVLLVAGAWLAAVRGRFALCGVLAGLALLTKPLGVAALPFLLVQQARQDSAGRVHGPTPRLRAWMAERWQGLVACAALAAAWPLYLAVRYGEPLRFAAAQQQWEREPGGLLGPLAGLVDGVQAGGRAALRLTGEPLSLRRSSIANLGDPVGLGMQDLVNLCCVAAIGALAVLAWRRLGMAAGLSVLACALVPLSAPSSDVPLLSAPRFLLVAVPGYVALALALGSRSRELVLALSAVSMGTVAFGWATWQWVG